MLQYTPYLFSALFHFYTLPLQRRLWFHCLFVCLLVIRITKKPLYWFSQNSVESDIRATDTDSDNFQNLTGNSLSGETVTKIQSAVILPQSC